MRTYEDFELWISADGDSFRVWSTGTGKSQGFTLDAAALRERTQGLGEAFEGREALQPAALQEAKSLGGTLFEAIFPRSIFSRWREVRTRWGLKKRDLRLRLHFERAGALAPLPWELLYDGERFLCLSADTPIVHHPEFSGSVPDCTVAPPLQVLVVLPEPLRQPDLDVYGEFLEIREELAPAIKNGSIVVEILERPTFRGLMERLKADPPVHALHFAGHGEALPEFGDGRLWFQQDGRIRNADPIPGFALAPMLNDAKVRFVFINACEGGRSASIENPGNLAYRLLEAGIPAVLALRSPIGNQAAKKFARTFYHLLAKGCPLEESVAAGRQALQTGAFGLAWASPVLYLRAPTGRVIWPKFPWRRIILFVSALVVAFGIALAAYKGKLLYEKLIRQLRPQTFAAVTSDPRCPSPPGLDFAFIKVKPGRFTMGAPSRRGDRGKERPAHEVEITKSYCVAAYEVTDLQWNAVLIGENATTSPGLDLPKVSVTWDEIQDFLAKLNERDPKGGYRMLSEAEFEYAGRAGSSAAYVFGDKEKDLKGQANCRDTGDAFAGAAPIGSFDPNKWGLHDIHGNVEEWVADRYAPYSPGGATQIDPQGPLIGTDRVRRGGSFRMNAKNCASWSRKSSQSIYRSDDLGFRIARSPVILAPPLQSESGNHKKLP
ncbi:MAG TPA: SUMF1/EgtB/PvdO family nonheme iron enzyme [Thermoanaerobaculia bacterium]|jgi:formylglycine-generating enzyme required for sulfatase activity|nr:SUMF1/EgtB/PvdO family nonheme iron enzyme [Thermoanaerobaculia bacterium]